MNPTEKHEFMELLKYESGLIDEAPTGTAPRGKMYRFEDGSRLFLMGRERKQAAQRARIFRVKSKKALDTIIFDLFA